MFSSKSVNNILVQHDLSIKFLKHTPVKFEQLRVNEVRDERV